MGGIVVGLEREGIAYTNEHASEMPVKADMIVDAGDIAKAARAIEQIAFE
jgi:hypothetical protein